MMNNNRRNRSGISSSVSEYRTSTDGSSPRSFSFYSELPDGKPKRNHRRDGGSVYSSCSANIWKDKSHIPIHMNLSTLIRMNKSCNMDYSSLARISDNEDRSRLQRIALLNERSKRRQENLQKKVDGKAVVDIHMGDEQCSSERKNYASTCDKSIEKRELVKDKSTDTDDVKSLTSIASMLEKLGFSEEAENVKLRAKLEAKKKKKVEELKTAENIFKQLEQLGYFQEASNLKTKISNELRVIEQEQESMLAASSTSRKQNVHAMESSTNNEKEQKKSIEDKSLEVDDVKPTGVYL